MSLCEDYLCNSSANDDLAIYVRWKWVIIYIIGRYGNGLTARLTGVYVCTQRVAVGKNGAPPRVIPSQQQIQDRRRVALIAASMNLFTKGIFNADPQTSSRVRPRTGDQSTDMDTGGRHPTIFAYTGFQLTGRFFF